MQKKKNIYLMSALSSLSLCSNVRAAEANKDKASVSTTKNEVKKDEVKNVDNKNNSFMSTIKKHPIASALIPTSVISLAVLGGYFLFFRGGDNPGGKQHPKAEATIDALNKLNIEDKNLKGFIAQLGGFGDNTVRVVVDFHGNDSDLKLDNFINHINKNSFHNAVKIIKTIITDALKTPNTEQSSDSAIKYEFRKVWLNVPRYAQWAWVWGLRLDSAEKSYYVTFGMSKNNDDLFISLDPLSLADWE